MDKSQKKYKLFIPTGLISLIGFSIYFWFTIHPFIGMRQQESAELSYGDGFYSGSQSSKLPMRPIYENYKPIKKGYLENHSNFTITWHELMKYVQSKDSNYVLKLALSPDCTYGDFINTKDAIDLAYLNFVYKNGVFYIFNYPQTNDIQSCGTHVIGGYPPNYRTGIFARVADWWPIYKIQLADWFQSIVELFTNNIQNQLILLCWLLLFIVGIIKNNPVARLTRRSS